MPKILKYSLQISLYNGLIAYCTLLFLKTYSNLLSIIGKALKNIVFFSRSTQKQSKYTLQNWAYSKKHSTYTPEVLKSSLNIQKSSQKQSKALIKYSPNLLFPINSVLFIVVSNQNRVL